MSCESCPFKDDSISGPIPGRWVGPQDGSPVIMVIGESPNLGDDQKGKVFTGSRGHLVHDIIVNVAPKARVYYMNLLKCRVVDDKKVTDKDITNCLNTIVQEKPSLSEINPAVIITLGNGVLKALTGKSGITTYWGQELEYKGYPLVPTVSPGAVLRNPKYTNPFKAHILKATSVAQGLTSKFKYEYIPVMNRESFREMLKACQIQKSNGKMIRASLDFETTTYDYWRPETKLMTMGLCFDGVKCYGIPMEHPKSPWRGQGYKILDLLRPYLQDPQVPVVGNNWKYDQKWSRAKIGMTLNFKGDNMLKHYALDENSPHGLEYQADTLCGSGHYKVTWPTKYDPTKHDINQKVSEYMSMDLMKILKHNALDAFYSWHIDPILDAQLKEDIRAWRIYNYLLEPASHMFVEIEEQGMWIDPERLANATKVCQEEIDKATAKLNALIPKGWCENNLNPKQLKDGFNWNSTKQLGTLFFQSDGFNFPILLRTDTGAPSTSESAILSLGSSINHPALDELLEYRKWAKFMSTYLRPWSAKLDKNSRLHPNFKIHGTVTGRLSGEDGVHQVPRDKFIRSIIGAPPGWSFFEIDGSQIELRVAAAVANERNMLRIYATGGDIHRTTAAAIMNKEAKEVTGDERKKAKAVNFGFLYGMGWKKFKIYAFEKYQTRVTDQEAKDFRARFFELYPDLPQWHARTRNLVRKLGYVVSPIGRKRRLPDIFSIDDQIKASAEREAINSPVQGFGSDYVLAAFIEMYGVIKKEDPDFETIRPVGTVHDAQYYEIRNDKIDYWAPKIKAVFDDATRLKEWFDYVPPLRITGDCKIGNHWGDAKDWTPGMALPHELR